MRKIAACIIRRIDAILAIIGISFIAAGVYMYSLPPALIITGILILLDVYLPKKDAK